MKNLRDPYVYAIVRIDIKTFQYLGDELVANGYSDIKVVIPTISLLKKTSKGQNHYEEFPMLFNYGFLRIRRSRLFNRDFVNNLPKEIPGLYSWVKSLDTLHPRKVKRRVDSMDIFDDFTKVATTPRSEIRRLLRMSKLNQIYNADDITGLAIGTYIVLRGYPYEGISATVLSISTATKSVKVEICHSVVTLIIDLDFDHVFYTPYRNYNEDELLSNTHAEYIENMQGEEDEPNTDL